MPSYSLIYCKLPLSNDIHFRYHPVQTYHPNHYYMQQNERDDNIGDLLYHPNGVPVVPPS